MRLKTNSVESICYQDTIQLEGKLNCSWDYDKSQTSSLTINQHFSIYRNLEDKNCDTILVLYQQYNGNPGELIVNNKKHIAFQTYIDVDNEIWKVKSKDAQNNREKLVKRIKSSPNGTPTSERNKDVEFITNKDYTSGTFLYRFHIHISKLVPWSIHQRYPFNSLVDKPQNFKDWLSKECSKSSRQAKYYANDIPDLSRFNIQGSLISVWSIHYSIEYIVLGTTVKHGLSDRVVGSDIKSNNFQVKEHNIVSEKVIYLNAKDL
ncbi:hypothetical protein ACTFIY_006577 [Dictyostelium cf. discoideum]